MQEIKVIVPAETDIYVLALSKGAQPELLVALRVWQGIGEL